MPRMAWQFRMGCRRQERKNRIVATRLLRLHGKMVGQTVQTEGTMTIESELEELRDLFKDHRDKVESKLEKIEAFVLASANPETVALINEDEFTEKWLRVRAGSALFEVSYCRVQVRRPNLGANEAEAHMKASEEQLRPLLEQLAKAGLNLEMERRNY